MEYLIPIKHFIYRIWEKIVQKVKYIQNKYFTKQPMAEKTIEITNMKKEDKIIDNMEKGCEKDKEIDIELKQNVIKRRKRRNSIDKIDDKWETIDIPPEKKEEISTNKLDNEELVGKKVNNSRCTVN